LGVEFDAGFVSDLAGADAACGLVACGAVARRPVCGCDALAGCSVADHEILVAVLDGLPVVAGDDGGCDDGTASPELGACSALTASCATVSRAALSDVGAAIAGARIPIADNGNRRICGSAASGSSPVVGATVMSVAAGVSADAGANVASPAPTSVADVDANGAVAAGVAKVLIVREAVTSGAVVCVESASPMLSCVEVI
jgi:hypothetical protein